MTKATYIVANERNPEGWEETYEFDPNDSPDQVIGALIESFNATLRPHEIPRRLVRIVSIEKTEPKTSKLEHRWNKQNLVTVSERGRLFDIMRCDRCGATGKRFGLGHVTLDKKFDKPKFQSCPGYDL